VMHTCLRRLGRRRLRVSPRGAGSLTTLALDAVVVFEYDTWRVDHPQAALELN
jgi:hypothetical protein